MPGRCCRHLEDLLHGEPADVEIHPRMPDCDPRGPSIRVPLGAGIGAAAALAARVEYRPTRSGRSGFGSTGFPTRFEPGRGVRPSSRAARSGISKSGKSIRTNGSSRGEWGCCGNIKRALPVAGQRRRVLAESGRGRHDIGSIAFGSSRAPGKSASDPGWGGCCSPQKF